MKAAAYLRVSTDSQECKSQRHDIEQWAAAHPEYEVAWYEDEGLSGASLKRPGFQRMLADIEAGEVQAVVCFRLDRISRSAPTALQLLLNWMQRGVEFFATSQPIFQLGKENPLRLTVVALFAELAQLERQAIAERTRAGLRAARDEGTRLGRPPRLEPERVDWAMSLMDEGLSARRASRETGISASYLAALYRRLKHQTARADQVG